MVPLRLFWSSQFSAANAVTFAVYGGLGGALFLVPVTLEEVSRYSPLRAGMALLPITVIMLALSARSGAWAARLGPRLQMSVGPVVAGAGLALLSRATGPGGYFDDVFPAVVVLGFGMTLTVAPLTATVLAAAPAEHSAVASAINNDVARTASLIAVAVLPAAAGIGGTSYLQAAELSSGFRTAMFLVAAICGAGGLLAALAIHNVPSNSDDSPAGEPDCALGAAPLRSVAAPTAASAAS